MENEKKKINKFGIAILILVFCVIIYSYVTSNQNRTNNSSEQSTTASFTDYEQPLGKDIINCEFKVTSAFTYKNDKDSLSENNRKVYYKTSVAPEDKKSLITFAGLSTKEPKIKGNFGDSPLSILKNDSETIVMAEQSLMGDTFIYTVFKKERVATWYKSYKMLVVPFGMLSMGYCY